MKPEQFEREKSYSVAVAITNVMFGQGIITEEDTRRMKQTLIRKYNPAIGLLDKYPEISVRNCGNRTRRPTNLAGQRPRDGP